MGNLNEVLAKIREIINFNEWQVGDEELFTLNDGAVLIELAENRELKIKVIVGKPTHLDLNLNLLENNNE